MSDFLICRYCKALTRRGKGKNAQQFGRTKPLLPFEHQPEISHQVSANAAVLCQARGQRLKAAALVQRYSRRSQKGAKLRNVSREGPAQLAQLQRL